MKKLLLLCFCLPNFVWSQTPCDNGQAGQFPCDNYDLLSQVSLGAMNSSGANDSWGWTDPQDGKEYAIICLQEATAFIDISNPENPIYLGKLPGEGAPSTWRDAKTYNNHVFIVSEEANHGMQVFDLTRLRSVSNPPEIFTKDAHYTGFGNAHNIAINEDTGYAYAIGTDTYNGGPHFINIQNPVQPAGASGYAGSGYTHDAQIITYNGPDTEYVGRELFIGSNTDEVVFVDVTDKSSPVLIDAFGYFNVSYTHQAWTSEDHRFLFLCDEIDEIDNGFNSRTVVFNMEDLDNTLLHFPYLGTTSASDHNGYVKGNSYFLANYTGGFREIDISQIENFSMTEKGYFDTHPANNNSGFNGAWNVYPFFESGNVVISDRSRGMFLVRSTEILDTQDFVIDTAIEVVPNPANELISVYQKGQMISTLAVVDALGKVVYNNQSLNVNSYQIDVSAFQQGIYFVLINNNGSQKFIKQ